MILPEAAASRERLVVRVRDDLGVLLIPKNASTSLRRAYGKPVELERWHGRLVVFVRDPLERLRSAFQTFFTDVDYFVRRNGNKPTAELWRPFVDAVLDGHGNGHWMAQSEFVRGVDVECLPFECVARLRLPRLHVSQRSVEPDAYRVADLERHYGADYALRDAAWRATADGAKIPLQ